MPRLIILFLFIFTQLRCQNIFTIAGNGTSAFSGDGGPATAASFNGALGITTDSNGNIYFCDAFNRRVRKIDPFGVISTVAGNGTQGYSGDGGSATSAQLSFPYGVAIDQINNLFIADLDYVIRKVNLNNGIITTAVGTGTPNFSGDGGPPNLAEVSALFDIAINPSGEIFICDRGNNRIRKISGGTITTVAGNGIQGYSGDGGPATAAMINAQAIAADGSGNLFIADTYNHRIRKVDLSGIITTIAGNGNQGFSGDGGPAISAMLDTPLGVAVNSNGDVFISDNNRIRKISTSGTITSVVATGSIGFSGDGGPASLCKLNGPANICTDYADNLFISDYSNNRMRVVCSNLCPMYITQVKQVDKSKEFLKVFPNPVTSTLFISANTEIITSIHITNSVGKRILESDKTNLKKGIDFSNQPSGLYFLNIQTESGFLPYKIIKE